MSVHSKQRPFSGIAPRGRFSRGAIALLRGPELPNNGFARLPDLLLGGDGNRHSFPDHGDGASNQPAGSVRRDGHGSCGGSPQRGPASASCRLANYFSLSHFQTQLLYVPLTGAHEEFHLRKGIILAAALLALPMSRRASRALRHSGHAASTRFNSTWPDSDLAGRRYSHGPPA